MSDRETNPAQPLVEPLTRRERDILALLAQGHNGPEIAERLGLGRSPARNETEPAPGNSLHNDKTSLYSLADGRPYKFRSRWGGGRHQLNAAR